MTAPDDALFPLLKYLDELVHQLRQLVADAVKGEDVDAVHDARVATRRLKAATQLLEPILSTRCRKPFDKITRCLRKQLGPLRDTDVMLEHLDDLPAGHSRDAKAWLKHRLTERRRAAVGKARKKAPPSRVLARLGSWWGLQREIADAPQAIDCLLGESVHLQLDAFAERANDRDHADPHALRIAGKSLRYTLEMARHHKVKIPQHVLATFKRMQTALGLWHDFVLLAQCMMSEAVECDLALHELKLAEQVFGLARASLRKAERQLKKMSDLWSQRGEALCFQIRQAFPLTPQPQMPLAGESSGESAALSQKPRQAALALPANQAG
jgi:CHAD domain-containing protein